MLLAIGGEDLLSTGEIPSILPTTTSCPSFTLPEGRDSHVAFNAHNWEVGGQRRISFVSFNFTLRHWFVGAGPLGEAVSRGTSLDKLGSIIQHSGKTDDKL